MKSALFIDLSTEASTLYENSFLKELKEQIHDIETLDLDGGSETTLFSHAGTMIKDCERTVMVIQVTHESNTRKFYPLAESLIKNKNKVLVLLHGQNPFLAKMLSVLKENIFTTKEISAFIPEAVRFLKNGQ